MLYEILNILIENNIPEEIINKVMDPLVENILEPIKDTKKVIDDDNAFEPLLAALMENGRDEDEATRLIDNFYKQQKEMDDFFRNISTAYNEAKEIIEDSECEKYKA